MTNFSRYTFPIRIIHLPKHMPQRPCNIVSAITRLMSPLHSTPNTRIMNMSTSAVCPHMTTNCVITCENNISNGVTPARKWKQVLRQLLFVHLFSFYFDGFKIKYFRPLYPRIFKLINYKHSLTIICLFHLSSYIM